MIYGNDDKAKDEAQLFPTLTRHGAAVAALGCADGSRCLLPAVAWGQGNPLSPEGEQGGHIGLGSVDQGAPLFLC